VSRKRRRHADPALAPRREPGGREQRAERERLNVEREKAKRELDRVHDGLARAIAIALAAIVYFGVSVANVFFGFFPPPEGLDLASPLLLIGIASLVGATILGRYLVGAKTVRQLARMGVFAIAGLGVVLAFFMLLFLASGATSAALVGVIVGLGLSWLMASLWITLLTRRALRLLRSTETAT
jgi:hypothetical protein